MKFDRSVWIFFVIAIGLRCVAINQPLVDAHLIRQCQTAAITNSLIEAPHISISSVIPWAGDLDGHYILELPLYNYLVIAVHQFVVNLDLAGKLTSIGLWIASFTLLQFIWRRLLDREQTFWANLLFIISPFEVFWGQAFMAEMLVQTLAFGFVLLAMRYNERTTLVRWIICATVGLIGLLVKLPETVHLYLILGFLVFRSEGWKAILRPRYLIAGLITIAALRGWSGYMDSVNAVHTPEWTSKPLIALFVGSWESRFHFKPWAMIFLYLGAFVAPGPGMLAILYGMWILWKEKDGAILKVWLFALVLYYVIWFGNAGSAQSYYNLPALAPLCALFGIALARIFTHEIIARWRSVALPAAILIVVIPMIPFWQYLFKQDDRMLAAAKAVKAHTAPTDVILFRPNHRFDMLDYPQNPVLAYCSGRRTFVWTQNTPERYRTAALERANWAVVTLPPPSSAGVLGAFRRFRGAMPPQLESVDWLESAGFHAIEKTEELVIYKRE